MSVQQPAATARREDRDGEVWFAWDRQFRASAEDVWAAVTEPARMERWIGTWSGDPATGAVAFRMTAEGDDVEAETFRIEVCDPPRRLRGRSVQEGAPGVEWLLQIDVVADGGTATLTFAARVDDVEAVSDTGPGWEYYLDRLVAAETGGDVTAVDWDRYYPALSTAFRDLAG